MTDPSVWVGRGPWRCGFTAGRLGTGLFGVYSIYDLGTGYARAPVDGVGALVASYSSTMAPSGTLGWTTETATENLSPAGMTARELCNGGVIPNDPVCAWHWTSLGRWTFDGITGAASAPVQGPGGTAGLLIRPAVMRWDGTEYLLQSSFDLGAYNLTLPGDTYDEGGIDWGTSAAWTWGERLQALWALMPELGRSELTGLIEANEEPGDALDIHRYWDGETITEPRGWDAGQWPWWPVYRRHRPEDMGTGTTTYVQPEYPVWIACSHVRPPILPTVEHEGGMEAGEQPTETIVAGASAWWFADGVPQHYRPMLLAGSWWSSSTFEDWSAGGTYYFMGCCNWFPFQDMGAYPKSDENGDEVDEWTPGDWVADFPENTSFPNRFGQYEYDWGLGGASVRGSAIADDSYPNLKIDGALRVPGFEFRVPEALRELIETHGAENLTVVASSATVVVTEPLRREYRYESARPAVNYRMRLMRSGAWPWGTGNDWRADLAGLNILTTGEWYGVTFDQLSDPGTGTETWKRQFHVTHTASDARYASPDSDNTHVGQATWAAAVLAATGEQPLLGRVPRFVPRRHPWYPTDSEHGPEDVEGDPESVKLGHALVGIQHWGSETGDGAGDHRVRQPLAALKRLTGYVTGEDYDATPSGLKPASTGSWPDPPFPPSTLVTGAEQAHRDADFLAYWYGELGLGDDTIRLDNVRYRYLGMSHVDPAGEGEEYEDEDNRLYDATPRVVNLVEVAEALLTSEAASGSTRTNVAGGTYTYRHHAYRLLPVLPHDPATAPSEVDGVPTGLAPLFATALPRVCDLVAEGGVQSGRMVSRVAEIVFQRFASWEIREWTITVADPEEVEHTVQVVTPWDEV